MARKKEIDGKNVIVKLPYTLIDKLKAATQGKRNCMGKEIRKRLESTFALGCISTYPLPPCETQIDTPIGQELGDGIETTE